MLAKLENELGVFLDEHRDALVRELSRILVAMAVEAHHGSRSRNGRPLGPKRCTICGGLAAPARNVCHSCRGRMRRERERLRHAHALELEAARNGERGELARQFAAGERVSVTRALAGS
jgi:hypothetical protein